MRAVLVGHRDDAKPDEITRVLPAAVEADVMRGGGLHLDDADGEFEFEEERAALVNDAGVAEVDRIGYDADARLAQVARPAVEPLVRKDHVALGLRERDAARQLRVEPRLEASFLSRILHLK